MKKVILTGDRPTGKMHLGHYIGSLANRIKLQHDYNQFVMIADIQALTDNFENPAKVTENVYEVALDYLAIGIDPNISTIFIQSKIPEIAELTVLYLNLVSLGRLERNPTVKNEIQQKGFGESIPAGFFCYPISQAADITIVKAEVVPVGEDQIPMIEQTNEIVRKFNRIYNSECLKEAKAYLSKVGRLVGIDGKGKASKSLGNAILLSDSSEDIKNKVFAMYTDSNHLKVTDPGQVEGNVVFNYLDAFHPNQEEVNELKSAYAKGGLGDMKIKAILNETLQAMLKPIREKRASISREYIKDMLQSGTEKTQKIAAQTMQEVKEAMGICYF